MNAEPQMPSGTYSVMSPVGFFTLPAAPTLAPTPAIPAEMLTMADIAKRLKVSTRTVGHWIQSGELKCVRVRSVVRVDPADLATFLAEQRHG